MRSTHSAYAPWVFRPRFPWKVRLSFVAVALLAAVGVFMAVVDPDARPMGLLIAAFSGGVIVYALLSVPRAVVFGDALIIQRRLRPDRRIEYRDITGFGFGRLVARTGRLRWASFDNASEASEAFDRLIDAGVIAEAQLDDRAARNDLSFLEASVWTAVVLFGLAALLFFGVVPLSWLDAYPDWVFRVVLPLGTLAALFLIIRYWRYRGPAT